MSDTQNTSPNDHLQGWFAGRLPDGWFAGPLSIDVDRDEILVIGTLAEPELSADATSETRNAALTARIAGFREDTRAKRMQIADEAERRFGRKVSWGARCGDQLRVRHRQGGG